MFSVDTRLPTPYGWTTVQDLMPGDSVFDELGYPVFVSKVNGVKYGKAYRVGFTNKTKERGSLLMTEDQLLCTWNRDDMKRFTRTTGIKTIPTDWPEHDGKHWTLGEVMDTYEIPDGKSRKLMHVIPTTFPLVTAKRDVTVDPYIMGLVIQLHDRYTGVLTCKEHMWGWYEQQFTAAGYNVTRTRKQLKRFRPMDDVSFSSEELNRQLNRMGEYQHFGSRLPREYLRGSAQQRMALLTGLLDISFDDLNTHGDTNLFHKRSSVMVWCGKSKALSEQVTELIRSLGYSAVPHLHTRAKCYTVSYTPIDNPYRYPKFRAEMPDLTRLKRNTFTRFAWRIQSVELMDEMKMRSFEVTSPSGLVSVGDLFVPMVAK